MINFLRPFDENVLGLHLKHPDVGPLGIQRNTKDYDFELGKKIIKVMKESLWCPTQSSYNVLASLINILSESKNGVVVYETCLNSLYEEEPRNTEKLKKKMVELGINEDVLSLTSNRLEGIQETLLEKGCSRETVGGLAAMGNDFLRSCKLREEYEKRLSKEKSDIAQNTYLVDGTSEECKDTKLLWDQSELKNIVQEICRDNAIDSSLQIEIISTLAADFANLKNETYKFVKKNASNVLSSGDQSVEQEFFEVLRHLGRIDEEFYESFSELLYTKLMNHKNASLRNAEIVTNAQLLISLINCFICYLSQESFSFKERQEVLNHMFDTAKKCSPKQLVDMREFIGKSEVFKNESYVLKMKNDSN